MADKKREQWYLKRLMASIPTFPVGVVVPGESPDFLVHSEEQTTGIEITQFHVPPQEGMRPAQELQSLKEQIVNVAHRIHTESGGPALYVTVYYRMPLNLAKRDIQSTAKELADAIRKTRIPETIHSPAVHIPSGDLPDSIANVHIHGSVDGKDQLWYADAGGWVTRIEASLINDVVTRKLPMARIARKKCDRLWLVIINDVFSRAAPAELKNDAMLSVKRCEFERVLWFAPHSGQVYEAPL